MLNWVATYECVRLRLGGQVLRTLHVKSRATTAETRIGPAAAAVALLGHCRKTRCRTQDRSPSSRDGLVARPSCDSYRSRFRPVRSPKNEREAPGFRHGEESGSDDRRLTFLFSINSFIAEDRLRQI